MRSIVMNFGWGMLVTLTGIEVYGLFHRDFVPRGMVWVGLCLSAVLLLWGTSSPQQHQPPIGDR